MLKYDVMQHDALKVICNENLKRPRNLGDIGSFGDIWVLAGIYLKIVKLSRFFRRYWAAMWDFPMLYSYVSNQNFGDPFWSQDQKLKFLVIKSFESSPVKFFFNLNLTSRFSWKISKFCYINYVPELILRRRLEVWKMLFYCLWGLDLNFDIDDVIFKFWVGIDTSPFFHCKKLIQYL